VRSICRRRAWVRTGSRWKSETGADSAKDLHRLISQLRAAAYSERIVRSSVGTNSVLPAPVTPSGPSSHNIRTTLHIVIGNSASARRCVSRGASASSRTASIRISPYFRSVPLYGLSGKNCTAISEPPHIDYIDHLVAIFEKLGPEQALDSSPGASADFSWPGTSSQHSSKRKRAEFEPGCEYRERLLRS
jgi:hypothetical protein